MTHTPAHRQFAEVFRSYTGYAASSNEIQAEMLQEATPAELAALNSRDVAHLFASLDPGIRLAVFRAAGRVARAEGSPRPQV